MTILLQTNPYVEEFYQQLNTEACEESKYSALVKSFLQSCLHLLRDEKAIVEIEKLIDSCDRSMFVVVAEYEEHLSNTNKEVHQIKKYIRTGREMRLNAQIGDYDMDEVILELGSELNVLTK